MHDPPYVFANTQSVPFQYNSLPSVLTGQSQNPFFTVKGQAHETSLVLQVNSPLQSESNIHCPSLYVYKCVVSKVVKLFWLDVVTIRVTSVFSKTCSVLILSSEQFRFCVTTRK